MKKILLIEDSFDIGELVKSGIKEHDVRQAHSISEGKLSLREANFDLVLIDVTLPDGSGFDLCHDLSQDPKYGHIPKIILTARGEISDKVFGFTCGAQDYVTKPFHLLELKARIDRYLSVRNELAESEIIHGCFSFSPGFLKCFHVTDDGVKCDLSLTPTEYRLFLTLVKNEGQTLSRKALEHSVWEMQGTNIQVRGIDTHIAHLRKKLGELGAMIVSVYGQGYAFQRDSKNAEAI